ncbi:MAG: glycosyltransferase family 39 protein [Candidatus Omnitrophica bacterium]|nr:glycosyltransferase family 39 protein [Candidatus Omnitrophota bacterium]
MSIKKRLFLAAVFLCIAVWAGFYLQSLHFGLHNFKDSAYYIILAEGLSRFQGLRALCYPGHPLSKYCAPLFPLMLSPILYFFGRNFVLMHGLVLLFSLLTLFFTYKYIENASDSRMAFWVTLYLICSWVFFRFSIEILTDIPFMFFISLSLYLFTLYMQDDKYLSSRGIMLSVAIVLAYFCRYAGIILFVSLEAYLLFRKENKKAIFLGSVFIVPFLLWNLRNLLIVNIFEPSLSQQLSSFLKASHFFANLKLYQFYFPDTLLPLFELNPRYHLLYRKIYLFIDFIVLMGLYINLRDKKNVFLGIFYLLFLLLLFLWPAFSGGRYFLPLLPLTIFYFLQGLKTVMRMGFLKQQCMFYSLAGIMIAFSFYYTFFVFRPSHIAMPYYSQDFNKLLLWAKNNIDFNKNEIVASNHPTVVYFILGKTSFNLSSASPLQVWNYIREYKAGYIFLTLSPVYRQRSMLPFLDKFKAKLKLIRKEGSAYLYRIEY